MDTPATATQSPAEHELAELIVTSLNIDWIKPEAIQPDATLFGGDLGLDSIDALELALAATARVISRYACSAAAAMSSAPGSATSIANIV